MTMTLCRMLTKSYLLNCSGLAMLRLRGSFVISRSCARGLSSASMATSRRSVVSMRQNLIITLADVRTFATGSDGFRETLEKINRKASDGNKKDEEELKKPENHDSENAGNEKVSSEKENENNPSTADFDRTVRKTTDFITDAYVSVKDNLRMAWDDLRGTSKKSTLRKSVMQAESFRRGSETRAEDDTDAEKYEGPTAMVVVKDRGSAWDQMKARLSSSPLIREMLRNTKKVKDAAAATDIGKKAFETGQSVKDKVDDVREYWETSQNPLVYKISGVWDSLTGETEEGIAISEICKLDPEFIKEDWSEEVKSTIVPLVINGHLRGDLSDVKPWLGEAVYNKLSADIKARKADGIVFDTTVVDIDENQTVIRYIIAVYLSCIVFDFLVVLQFARGGGGDYSSHIYGAANKLHP